MVNRKKNRFATITYLMCCWRMWLLSSQNTFKCNWNVDDMRLMVNKQQADMYCAVLYTREHFNHSTGYCFWHTCICTNSLPFISTEAEFYTWQLHRFSTSYLCSDSKREHCFNIFSQFSLSIFVSIRIFPRIL